MEESLAWQSTKRPLVQQELPAETYSPLYSWATAKTDGRLSSPKVFSFHFPSDVLYERHYVSFSQRACPASSSTDKTTCTTCLHPNLPIRGRVHLSAKEQSSARTLCKKPPVLLNDKKPFCWGLPRLIIYQWTPSVCLPTWVSHLHPLWILGFQRHGEETSPSDVSLI